MEEHRKAETAVESCRKKLADARKSEARTVQKASQSGLVVRGSETDLDLPRNASEAAASVPSVASASVAPSVSVSDSGPSSVPIGSEPIATAADPSSPSAPEPATSSLTAPDNAGSSPTSQPHSPTDAAVPQSGTPSPQKAPGAHGDIEIVADNGTMTEAEVIGALSTIT